MGGREKERFSIYWFTPQMAPICQSWAHPKAGAKSGGLFWGGGRVSPTWVQRPKALDHPAQLSQARKQEAGSEMERLGHKLASIWDASTTVREFACYTTMPAPINTYLKEKKNSNSVYQNTPMNNNEHLKMEKGFFSACILQGTWTWNWKVHLSPLETDEGTGSMTCRVPSALPSHAATCLRPTCSTSDSACQPAVGPEKQRAWVKSLISCTDVGSPGKAPGSWLQTGLAQAFVAIEEWTLDGRSLCFFLKFCLSNKNKLFFKKKKRNWHR